MKFEVSGKRYAFDAAPEKLMGDEIVVLEQNLPAGWAERWASLELGVLDVMMLTYLAAKRAGETRPYGEFVKTIAPLTFESIDEPAPAAAPRSAAAGATPPADAIGPALRTRKTRAKTAEPAAAE